MVECLGLAGKPTGLSEVSHRCLTATVCAEWACTRIPVLSREYGLAGDLATLVNVSSKFNRTLTSYETVVYARTWDVTRTAALESLPALLRAYGLEAREAIRAMAGQIRSRDSHPQTATGLARRRRSEDSGDAIRSN